MNSSPPREMDVARVRSSAIRICKLFFGANRLSPYGRRSRSPNRQKIAEHAAPINLISIEGTGASDFVRESVRFIERGAPVFIGMVLNKNIAINTK